MRKERMKKMTAKFPGRCEICGGKIEAGQEIYWAQGFGAAHASCMDRWEEPRWNGLSEADVEEKILKAGDFPLGSPEKKEYQKKMLEEFLAAGVKPEEIQEEWLRAKVERLQALIQFREKIEK